VEVSGSKSVVFCGGSTYKVFICIGRSLPDCAVEIRDSNESGWLGVRAMLTNASAGSTELGPCSGV
jgi:hypothetical protein